MKDFVAFVIVARKGGVLRKSQKIFDKFDTIKVSFMVSGYFEIGDAGYDNAIVVGKYNKIEDLINLRSAFANPNDYKSTSPEIMFVGSDFMDEYDVLNDEAEFTKKQISIMEKLDLTDKEYCKLVE